MTNPPREFEIGGKRLPWDLPWSCFKKTTLSLGECPAQWVAPLFREARRCCQAPGWHPKMIGLGGDWVLVGLTVHGGYRRRADGRRVDFKWLVVPALVGVVEYVDHPFLAQLPRNAPRVVKAMYRREVRMRHLKAQEYWDFARDSDAAADAWRDYREAALRRDGQNDRRNGANSVQASEAKSVQGSKL